MQYSKASSPFLSAHSRLTRNNDIGKALQKIEDTRLWWQFSCLSRHFNTRNLSTEAVIKHKYAIFTELQRFSSANEEILRSVNIFEKYCDLFEPLETAFDLSLLEYERISGETFQNLLNREGVPNGLPEGYCFEEIFREFQKNGRIPESEAIPFIVYLSIACFDMPPENFKSLCAFQSIEHLEVRLFGEFISSFVPVSKLHRLRYLSVEHCPVTNLEPLAKLKNLKAIEFDSCHHLSDISALAEISSLEKVYFFDSEVSNYSPLLSLQNLTSFITTNQNESALAVYQKLGIPI